MTNTAAALAVTHGNGFSHSSNLQCTLCPGYPHRDCLPRSLVALVDALHALDSGDGTCTDCGQSWPCPTSRLVHSVVTR